MNTNKFTIGAASLAAITALAGCDNDFDYHIDEDQHHVRVYIDDEQLACDSSSAMSLAQSAFVLAEQDIEMHCSQKGHDGFSYTESCGSDTGSINIFTIHMGDLAEAENLGFARLATLDNPQFDDMCEYKVISDHKKYHLLDQVKDAINVWEALDSDHYEFKFDQSFADCPNVTAPPTMRITVEDDVITQVYNMDTQEFVNDISGFKTVSELLAEFKLQIWMSAKSAGLSSSEPYKMPSYSDDGVPLSYYFDQGTNVCDAPNTSITDFTNLASS
ncbi:DUF6174 domain-containing protein [Catenovulum agarivorans]|uniref:DUF6174 domain-containing protein n=1 Tax=Catenovulum agarivorans TaxID=1172192 RepID=UPI0002DDEAA4|nr:DUF6174 domain-containing protein [Catenovulum agarivorans]